MVVQGQVVYLEPGVAAVGGQPEGEEVRGVTVALEPRDLEPEVDCENKAA